MPKGACGIINGELAATTSRPNNVCSEARTPGHKFVEPLPTGDKAKITAAIIAEGGEITVNDSDYLAAEFTSKVFKFVDDVEIRLDGDKAHIRSASRTGYSDRGVNRKRVEALRERLTD